MPDYTGKIIEFLDSGAARLALVTRDHPERLQVMEASGRQHKVAVSHVLVLHRASASPSDFAAHAADLERQIAPLAAEVDGVFLWESLTEEHRESTLATMAELYFGANDPLHQAAILRAVVADMARFRLRGATIEIRTAEQVNETLQAKQRKAEREAFVNACVEWLKAFRPKQAPAPIATPGYQDRLLALLEDFLLRSQQNEAVKWLEQLRPDLPPREFAWRVLDVLGRLPDDTDPMLLIAGVRVDFTEAQLAEADTLKPFPGCPDRRDFSHLPCFAIDDDDTREIDDAFTVELLDDRLRLGIHIADVAWFVKPGTVLDLEALRRGTTIYLPQRTVTMFPERLGCDLASLRPGQLRPTMSVVADFSLAGELLDWSLQRGQIRLTEHLSYENADATLAGGDGSFATELGRLDELAKLQLARRTASGAITVVRPELKVKWRAGELSLKTIDPLSPSRRLVAEFMILANHLAATFAARVDLPIIYRMQDAPSEPLKPSATYDPLANAEIFRKLKRSRFSLYPQPHAGLGIDAYTQFSSPIRRYADLVIQRQLTAHFINTALPYDQTELMRVLGVAEASGGESKDLENKAVRFYLLQHLASLPREQPLPGVALQTVGGGQLVELGDYYIRGLLLGPNRPSPGTALEVRLKEVVPERDVLTFERA